MNLEQMRKTEEMSKQHKRKRKKRKPAASLVGSDSESLYGNPVEKLKAKTKRHTKPKLKNSHK